MYIQQWFLTTCKNIFWNNLAVSKYSIFNELSFYYYTYFYQVKYLYNIDQADKHSAAD